jgi:hypothetical protein
MSFAFKMQQELHQVESQIYDLETIFLSTNRYGKLSLSTDSIPSTNTASTNTIVNSSSLVQPMTPNKLNATITNSSRIFSKTSMTSPIEQ